MKTELLCANENWMGVSYTSKKEILEQYPKAVFVTDTDKHDYYASNDSNKILFRIVKPKRMTVEAAEKKYHIEITGSKLVK